MIPVQKQKLKLTKEQYDKLNTEELRWFLRTAYYSSFITGLTIKQANELFQIYNEIFREKKRATSCSQCRLEVCMRLGKLFFEFEDELKSNENEDEEDMTEEELEKAADEINEAIIKDIIESHAEKTKNTKTTKTNNRKGKKK